MADPLNFPPDSELRWYGSPTPGAAVRAVIGLLHPGEMGAAVGAACIAAGAEVLWASDGRSAATALRADQAGLRDVGWLNGLVNQSQMVLSVCPPDAAEAVAGEVADLGFNRLYVDANAIAPATARRIAERVEQTGADFVDGGIIGAPPVRPGLARLYLSGPEAQRAARMVAGGPLEVVVLDGPVGAASALKMAYAAWTKGTSALLASIEALALTEGVHGALLQEWAKSQPALLDRSAGLGSAAAKAWRWIGEMREIAATFEAAGLPSGVPAAAEEIYRALAPFKDDADAPGGAELARFLVERERASG
ncbi:MAG: DUF1932 domain-containing protein [Dehalococcoidia bacterium]